MKKFILFILFAFTLATTFTACTDEEIKPQTETLGNPPGGGASDGKQG